MWAQYIRVSSERQSRDDRYGLDRQRREIKRYLEHQGFEGVPFEFSDIISGTVEDRVGFEEMLSSARSGFIRQVVVSEYDRLGRNMFTSFALMGEMVRTGLEVHSSQDGKFDPNSSRDRRDFAMRSGDADSELERIKRRLYSGTLDKVRSGKPSRPLDAFGWLNGTVNENERSVLLWMYERALEVPVTTITAELTARGVKPRRGGQAWHFSSVRKILSNPLYIGQYQFGLKGERISIAVPPLVDLELFNSVQKSIASRRRGQRYGGRVLFDFQGKIFCAVCGSAMAGTAYKKTGYYRCWKGQTTCSHKVNYHADAIHAAVREVLQSEFSSVESLIPISSPRRADIGALRGQLETQLTRIEQAYEAGAYSLEKFQNKKRSIEVSLESLENAKPIKVEFDSSNASEVINKTLKIESLKDIAETVRLKVFVNPLAGLTVEIGV